MSRMKLVLAVFWLGFASASCAQGQQAAVVNPAEITTATGPTSGLSLVGKLEGVRTWMTADFKQRTGAIKLEQVKIENGKGTGRLWGYGSSGRCGSAHDILAELTLDSGGILTIVAPTENCGTWEYTLQRVGPTTFKGRHRVNPTEIVLEFSPG